MDKSPWSDDRVANRHWTDVDMEALAKPSILLAEDDEDIRHLLTTLLHLSGFQIVARRTAEEALEELRQSPFDLVLTDYCLPHRTGGWLLQQASAEGLLEATPALVVTAHPNPPETQGFEIITKPFDLDHLVERVRRRLTGERQPRRQPNGPRGRGRKDSAGSGSNGSDGSNGGVAGCPDPIELILYVSPHSPRTAAAVADIKSLLARFDSSRVKLTICDLSQNPGAGAREGVAFTPTLVKRSPGPRTFILGHLTNPALLLELLEGCEDR